MGMTKKQKEEKPAEHENATLDYLKAELKHWQEHLKNQGYDADGEHPYRAVTDQLENEIEALS